MHGVRLGLFVATKYLLEFYFVVRILLVFRKAEMEERDTGIRSRFARQSDNDTCCAERQGVVWSADHAGELHALYDSFRESLQEDKSLCGNGDNFFNVLIYEGNLLGTFRMERVWICQTAAGMV